MNTDDAKQFEKALTAYGDDAGNYDPRADLDHDGDVDNDDENLFIASHAATDGLSGNWKLSQGLGLPKVDGAPDGLDNRFGWRGYWYDPHLELYHVRHRVYDPREGKWLQTDPLGFAAGDQDLYRYCGGEYSMGYDPGGLEPGHWYDGIGTLLWSLITPLSRDSERVSAWSSTTIVTRIERDGSHYEQLYTPPPEDVAEPGGVLDRTHQAIATRERE